jgi:muconolactone delta-isomerase
MHEWLNRHRESGLIEQAWIFAGQQGGGGIANVEGPDELNDLVTENSLLPFSSIEVYPLGDIDRAFAKQAQVIEHMMEMMQQ